MNSAQQRDDDDIVSLNGDDLFIEALEQRLELALALLANPPACNEFCGCACGALSTCKRACAF